MQIRLIAFCFAVCGAAVQASDLLLSGNPDFGRVPFGEYKILPFQVTNSGASPILPTRIQLTGLFRVIYSSCRTPLTTGQSCDLNVVVFSSPNGRNSSRLKVTGHAGNVPHSAALTLTATLYRNLTPVASSLSFQGTQGQTISGTLTGQDSDGDVLSYSIVAGPSNGSISVPVDGGAAFTYTPAPDYSGTDTFTYVARDGRLNSNAATVSLIVRPRDIFVPIVANELAEATTVRLQQAIDRASSLQVGLRLQANGVYLTERELVINAPGPLFLDGAGATLRKVANPDAVLRIAGARDGFTVRDLDIFASDGSFSQVETACTIQWPREVAEYGIILNSGRGITLSGIRIQNASKTAVLVDPSSSEIAGLTLDTLVLKFNGEGLRLNGKSTSRIRSTRVFGTVILFTKSQGATLSFVEDLTWLGGSIEKSQGDSIRVSDSSRIEFFGYTENYGGWQIISWSQVPYHFCPRNVASNAVRLTRTANFRFRGRIGDERLERGTGPLATIEQSQCYEVSSKAVVLSRDAGCAASIQRPVLETFAANPIPEELQEGTALLVLPSDSPEIVRQKFRTAASSRPRLGITLSPWASYNWPMIVMTGNADTPAFIRGRGAIISLVGGSAGAPVDAVFKLQIPTNWVGTARFFIRDLTLRATGARYGIQVSGGQSLTLKGIRIEGALEAGVRGEGRPGAGFYYNTFADISVLHSGKAIEIVSLTNEKYAGANFIRNLRVVSVPTVLSLHWTGSVVAYQVQADWRGEPPNSPKLLLDTTFTSDVDGFRVVLPGTSPAPALIRAGMEVRGINFEYSP